MCVTLFKEQVTNLRCLPNVNIMLSPLSLHPRSVEQSHGAMAQMGQNTKHGANRVSIRVKAAALNIEDHHIASGWCANYNLWKRDPLEAANRAFMCRD